MTRSRSQRGDDLRERLGRRVCHQVEGVESLEAVLFGVDDGGGVACWGAIAEAYGALQADKRQGVLEQLVVAGERRALYAVLGVALASDEHAIRAELERHAPRLSQELQRALVATAAPDRRAALSEGLAPAAARLADDEAGCRRERALVLARCARLLSDVRLSPECAEGVAQETTDKKDQHGDVNRERSTR